MDDRLRAFNIDPSLPKHTTVGFCQEIVNVQGSLKVADSKFD